MGDGGGWTVDWGEILCCCVFSVKQLALSIKGRISEEMRSKDHLPTYRSWAGFSRGRGREREREGERGREKESGSSRAQA